MQVDTTSPEELEVMREMGFPNRLEIAGPDGFSSCFFNEGGEVLISQLTKLLRSLYKKTDFQGLL